MAKPRNILAGRKYDLGAAKQGGIMPIAPTWVHLGVVGGGVALGYVTYPYWQQPLGMTLMGAAGTITAVGILLLVYDLVRDKNLQAGAMA